MYMNWRFKPAENHTNLIRYSKGYTKIDKQYNSYKNDFISYLRNLGAKDLKAYWFLLNKYSDTSKTAANKVALEFFFDHF